MSCLWAAASRAADSVHALRKQALLRAGAEWNPPAVGFRTATPVGTRTLTPMPRFHSNMRDSDSLLEDLEGADFPDLDAARADAAAASREVLAERIEAGLPLGGLRFEIRDEAGQLVATVPIRDAAQPA